MEWLHFFSVYSPFGFGNWTFESRQWCPVEPPSSCREKKKGLVPNSELLNSEKHNTIYNTIRKIHNNQNILTLYHDRKINKKIQFNGHWFKTNTKYLKVVFNWEKLYFCVNFIICVYKAPSLLVVHTSSHWPCVGTGTGSGSGSGSSAAETDVGLLEWGKPQSERDDRPRLLHRPRTGLLALSAQAAPGPTSWVPAGQSVTLLKET